jgi:hypothetical protein
VVKLNPESELHFMSLFKGSEPIQGSGTVIFNGELQLGDEPKLLTVEGRVNFASTSMLKIKVAGVQRGESYDAIDVGLSVNLGGTLSVELLPNVVLAAGDVFEVLRANEIVGEFENIILPNVEGQNITVSLNQTASKVELVVTQNTVVVNAPEAETSSGGGSTNMGFIVFLLMTIVCRLSFLRRRFPTVNDNSQSLELIDACYSVMRIRNFDKAIVSKLKQSKLRNTCFYDRSGYPRKRYRH